MANRKISDLTSLTAPATGDLLPIVDISEAAAADKNKKITYGELLASAPDGSAAAPSFSFDSDPDSGLYSAGANQVAISTNGTQRLVVDSNGKLSVTSATAAVALITGPANAYIDFTDGTGIFRTQLSSNTPVIGAASNHGLIFTTNNTERLRINPAGRVGVGTSAPAELFHVEGSTSPTIRIRNSTTGSTASPASTFLSFNGFNQEGRVRFEAQDRRSSVNGGFLNIATANSSNVLTNALHIDNAQQVGIGTTTPSQLLDISGGAIQVKTGTSISDTTYDWLRGYSGNSDFGVKITTIQGSSSTRHGLGIWTSNAASPVERVRITDAGLVGIGTTSPSNALHVEYSSTVLAGLRIRNTDTTATAINGIDLSVSNGSAGAYFYVDSAVSGGSPYNVHIKRGQINASICFDNSAGTEHARIDSSGRLLVGTSTARSNLYNSTVTSPLQVEGTTDNNNSVLITMNAASATGPRLDFAKSRGSSVGSNTVAVADDTLGTVSFQGSDGTEFVAGAYIQAQVDGTPGANDMPGRIVLSTTLDGAASPTERFRITNDGVIAHDQPAPAAVNATATLTIANLKAGIITSTSALATDMTLPTGTDTQAGFSGTYDNFTFEWSVINTGVSLVRVLAGTAHTVVGSGSVLTGTSGRFASRRTAANTFFTYRLA